MVGRIAFYIISVSVVIIGTIVMFLQRETLYESSVYTVVTLSFFIGTGIGCLIMLSLLILTIKRTFTDAELDREMK